MSETFGNFINNQWVTSDTIITNINPSDTTDIIGQYAQANDAQLNECIESARKALPALRSFPLEARSNALNMIGKELMERAEELGKLLSREEGKPLPEGKGEVYRAGQFFCYYAGEVLRQLGENADSVRPQVEIDIRREPMGVVAVISPWNFPTATASWKIAPALAFGNAVIWKPANLTPASAYMLTDIIQRSGLAQNALQLVMGSGSHLGHQLVSDKRIDAVSFTGSYEVGVSIAQAASANLTKFQLELGSKNALMVLEDADIDSAVSAAVVGGYSGTGQKCTASSRLVIHKKIYDAFLDKLTTALSQLTVGNALDPNTKMGPVVSKSQLDHNMQWVEKAQNEGANLVYGGKTLTCKDEGYYMAPTLFTDTHNKMTCNREEIFAPLCTIQTIDTYEEGLHIVNDTDYGLVAGLFTRSLAKATHFRRSVETGCVTINLPTAGTDYHVPFGGRKNSSFGSREQGKAAHEFYTQVKTSYIHSQF